MKQVIKKDKLNKVSEKNKNKVKPESFTKSMIKTESLFES